MYMIHLKKKRKRGGILMNIEEPTFKRVMRGYDIEEVKQSWAEMSQIIANQNAANIELQLQINSLKEQNNEWGNRLKNYEKMETDLRDAVISTQKMSKQAREEAELKSEELLESARLEAENILNKAMEDANKRDEEISNQITENQAKVLELGQQIDELTSKKEELKEKVERACALLTAIRDTMQELTNELTDEE